MDRVVCESKLLSVMRSSMPPCPGNWVAIVRAVLYLVQELNVGTVHSITK